MVFNATFNNISVISWRSVLLVEETGVPGENHRTATSHWQPLSHNVVHLALSGIRTHNISGHRHRFHPETPKIWRPIGFNLPSLVNYFFTVVISMGKLLRRVFFRLSYWKKTHTTIEMKGNLCVRIPGYYIYYYFKTLYFK
jgi:hypothetical protein